MRQEWKPRGMRIAATAVCSPVLHWLGVRHVRRVTGTCRAVRRLEMSEEGGVSGSLDCRRTEDEITEMK